jgi:hypothetical protein
VPLEEVTAGITQPPLVTQGPATEIISGVSGWAALHKIADSGVSRFEAEFVKATARASSGINRAAIQSALKGRNKQKALRLAVDSWNTQSQSWKASILDELTDTVAAAATTVSKRVLTNPSAIQFDATNPLARKWSRSQAARLVGNVGDDQIKTLRNVISQGFEDQPITVTDKLTGKTKTIYRPLTPKEVERRVFKTVSNIKGDLGLQSRQQIALKRFEQDLIKKKVRPSMLKKRVATYRKKLLRQRARAIARTELMRASNMGQQLLWEEAVSQGHLNPAAFEKVWITTPDDRLCQYCRAKNGQRVGIFDTFNNPVGNPEPQPPLHPMCRCSTALVKKGKGVQKVKAPTRSTQTTGKVTKPKKPTTPKPKPASKAATLSNKQVGIIQDAIKATGDTSKWSSKAVQFAYLNRGKTLSEAGAKKFKKLKYKAGQNMDDAGLEWVNAQTQINKLPGQQVFKSASKSEQAIAKQLNREVSREAGIAESRALWPIDDDVVRKIGSKYVNEVDARYLPYVEKRLRGPQKGLSEKFFDSGLESFVTKEGKDIREYTGSLYEGLNKELRSKPLSFEKAGVAKDIQRTIDQAPKPPPPELVWRGVNKAVMKDGVDGDMIRLDGFQSTSINPQTAVNWTTKSDTVILEIKPTRGLYVKEVSRWKVESELLLPTHAKYRIVGRRKLMFEDGRSRSVIQLEMIK